MKKIVIILSLFAFITGSCKSQKPKETKSIDETRSYNDFFSLDYETLQADTVIWSEKYLLFGQDSAYRILRHERRVIYTTTIPDYGVHYREYDNDGNLLEISYSRHIPLTFDSIDYGYDMHPHPDSVIRYKSNGDIQIGYIEYEAGNYQYALGSHFMRYTICDSTGVLIEKATYSLENDGYTYETFYRNGKIKEKNIQGLIYGSGNSLGVTKWDSLGNKTKEYQYDYTFPPDGVSYNDLFGVTTVTEYYPNGKVKQITKTKSFVESDVCPCGQWLYYDEKGQKIRTEKHKPCDNLLLDCEEE